MKALIINCSPVRDGATAELVRMAQERLRQKYQTKAVCIDDYRIAFCRGCRRCHTTAECALHDDVPALVAELDAADIIVAVSPSYWADVPGQLKAFIDRCTPWCDTHEPHARIGGGKRGYVVALRTGPGMKECERIHATIEHFFGHLGIERSGRLGLCSVACREDALAREADMTAFLEQIEP